MAASGSSWSKGRFVPSKGTSTVAASKYPTNDPRSSVSWQKGATGPDAIAMEMESHGKFGKPSIVDQSQLDSYVAANETEVFRGVRTETEYDNFKKGNPQVGGGYYGGGIYTAGYGGGITREYAVAIPASIGGGYDRILRMSIKKDARVILHSDARDEMRSYRAEQATRIRDLSRKNTNSADRRDLREQLRALKHITSDVGVFVAWRGKHDVIEVLPERYHVILNPGVLRVQDQRLREDQIVQKRRRGRR